MRELRARASAILADGLTKRRALIVLRREFPHAERDELAIAVGLKGAPTGTPGLWVQLNPHLLRPVIMKRPPKRIA